MAKVKVAGTGVVCLSHLMYVFVMKVSSEEASDSLILIEDGGLNREVNNVYFCYNPFFPGKISFRQLLAERGTSSCICALLPVNSAHTVKLLPLPGQM